MFDFFSELFENSENELNRTVTSGCNDTLTNEIEKQEDDSIFESEEDTYCDQLREMTPTKISQLLDRLELDDQHIATGEIQEDSQICENYQENPQQKKGRATKVKKEPKKTKGKKANEFEKVDDNKELISTMVGASKEDTTKTEKIKRGQKEAFDEDSLKSKDSNKAVIYSKSHDLEPSEVLNDKKPNKSKGKKANQLEHNDEEETIPTKVGASKEESAKTDKPKRGKKEAVDVDSLSSKNSNKANINSKSSDSAPSQILNDKKPNKSKKAAKGKEADEENINVEENPKDKKASSKTKMPTNSSTDKTATKDKIPPITKKQELKEATIKEKPSKPTKKTANEITEDLDSKITKGVLKPTIEEEQSISNRTRANKIPREVKANEDKQEADAVKVEEKPSGRSQRNKNQTDQEVLKPKEKETVKNLEKKVSNKNQKITENSENKENKAKNTKVKPKTEPTKKEKPVDTKGKTVVAEKVETKRAARKK